MPVSGTPSAGRTERVLLRRGTLLDGTGGPASVQDLLIGGGRILRRGTDLARGGATEVDLGGSYVAPGFIDVHSHSDNAVLLNPSLDSKVAQGVTTEVVGNCGESLFPYRDDRRDEFRRLVSSYFPGVAERLAWDWTDLDSWAARVEERRPAINLAPLVGHGTARTVVAGFDARPLSAAEQSELESLVDIALAEGAFGLSTGLAYPPGFAADRGELLPLVRRTAAYEAVYATHMRNEGSLVSESLDESIELARQSGVRLEISHLKVMERALWGTAHALLDILTRARAEGLRVRADQYPYRAGETGLFVLLPPWALDGPWEATARRLRDPATRVQIVREMTEGGSAGDARWQDVGWENLVVSDVRTAAGRRWLGRNLQEIGRAENRPPVEMAIEILEHEGGDASVLVFAMSDEDVRTIGEDPHILVGSDGIGNSIAHGPSAGQLHPRNYGTFPRFLVDRSLSGSVPLPQAVRRMTGEPADHFRIPDRGYLSPGGVADLAVWPFSARDPGPDFGEDSRYARFFQSVWVAGEPVLWAGEFTGSRAGRVLKRSSEIRPPPRAA